MPAVPPMVVQMVRGGDVVKGYDIGSLKEVICSGAPLAREHIESFVESYPHITLTQLLTMISTVNDLNYPEKTDTYFIVNAPYIFSACWKVVKPLLQERTRRKIQVLQGSGKGELLKVIEVSTSKTGKHDHAKCHFMVIDIFNSKKLEDIVPSSYNHDVPHVNRTDYQLIDISEDGFVSLLTENGNTTDDLRLPTEDNSKIFF